MIDPLQPHDSILRNIHFNMLPSGARLTEPNKNRSNFRKSVPTAAAFIGSNSHIDMLPNIIYSYIKLLHTLAHDSWFRTLYSLRCGTFYNTRSIYSKSHPKRGYKINEPRNLSLRRSWAHEHLHKLGNMFLGNHFSQERSIQVWLSHLHWQEIAKMIYRQMWLRRREKLAERKFHAKLLQQLLLPPLEWALLSMVL